MRREILADWLIRVEKDMEPDDLARFEEAAEAAFKAKPRKVVSMIQRIVDDARRQYAPEQEKLLEWAEIATKVLMYLQAQAAIDGGNLTEDLQASAEAWYGTIEH